MRKGNNAVLANLGNTRESFREACTLRAATREDVSELLSIEQTCFVYDRLSERSFRRHIQTEHSDLIVCEKTDTQNATKQLLGYALSFRHRGTRLARLYSIAVLPECKGQGLGKLLLESIEKRAAKKGRIFMRLEVAKHNNVAVEFYKQQGYRIFGEYTAYYEDNDDALRMQKKIRYPDSDGISRLTPWVCQTTEFTCGPASLMMAMSSLDPSFECTQQEELSIWREATTIFMTSGHGGCHPFGLALAARKKGFVAEVVVNVDTPLFLESVRSENKKQVLSLVHESFLDACHQEGVQISYQDVVLETIDNWLREEFAVLVLISTYRLDGKKAPHWVVITGIDEICLYVHDPDVDEKTQEPIDCQHVPIARDDFNKMAAFGANRMRSAVAIRRS